MTHRTFLDATGTEWEAWEVYPKLAERRTPRERRQDRRDVPARRTHDEIRVALASGLCHGWLAFRSREERRRCAPIPAGWEVLSDEGLRQALGAAQQSTAPRRLIE